MVQAKDRIKQNSLSELGAYLTRQIKFYYIETEWSSRKWATTPPSTNRLQYNI